MHILGQDNGAPEKAMTVNRDFKKVQQLYKILDQ